MGLMRIILDFYTQIRILFPMDDTALKRQLLELAHRLGAKRVCAALIDAGLSPRQADKLSLGDHDGGFRRKTVSAVRAVLANAKAS